MWVTIHEKRGKDKTGQEKKRGQDYIPILLYTESKVIRGKSKPQKMKSAQKRKSHLPDINNNSEHSNIAKHLYDYALLCHAFTTNTTKCREQDKKQKSILYSKIHNQ